MLGLWLLSLRLRDSSIVDIFWGWGFVCVAWLGFVFGTGNEERKLLCALLTTLWGGRLALYLYFRNRHRGEDPRYVAMRQRRGSSWWIWSLPIVFGLQGTLMWIISLPLQLACSVDRPLGILDALGVALVLTGVGFEALADRQLSRFKKDPAHKGQLMNRGLWSWSRHPNYFGDFVVWWGLFALAASTGIGAWTAISPLVMSVLLLRVSGVTLLEQSMSRRPGWAEYARRTSAFFPRPPRS